MNPFPYDLDPDLDEYTTDPAVYRLNFGKKYFIYKGRFFKQSVEQNLTDINKMLYKQEKKVDHIFYPVVEYIKRFRIPRCMVQMIIQTTDPFDLVNAERNVLATGSRDENCLNNVYQPHIPKWLAEQLSESPAVPQIDQLKSIRREIKPKVERKAPGEPKIPMESKSRTVAKEIEPSGKFNALMAAFGNLEK